MLRQELLQKCVKIRFKRRNCLGYILWTHITFQLKKCHIISWNLDGHTFLIRVSGILRRVHYPRFLKKCRCKNWWPDHVTIFAHASTGYLSWHVPDKIIGITLQWYHNERRGVSNHRFLDGLLNLLLRLTSQKTSKPALPGHCGGIHRWPVDSPHKGLVSRKSFPWHDVPWKLEKLFF